MSLSSLRFLDKYSSLLTKYKTTQLTKYKTTQPVPN